MPALRELLREAQDIRAMYATVQNENEKARLKARYGEIDAELQRLREGPAVPVATAAPPKSKKSRIKKTVLDPVEPAALELLNLCQSIVQDGALSDAEIQELRGWLNAHSELGAPGIVFLRDIVAMVLADGRIDAEERKQLHRAVETVLPPDLRTLAVQRRKTADALAKERAKAERQAAREAEQAEWEQNRCIEKYDFMVAGVSYENRGAIVKRYVRVGDPVYLARDTANRYSRNAVEVRTGHGYMTGFVPEDDAYEVSHYLSQGAWYKASVKKVLDRGRVPIPVVVVEIYRPGSTELGLVTEQQTPKKAAPAAGCLSGLAVLVLAAALAGSVCVTFAAL